MEDPNSAAVANAIQAGNNFWGRVQGIRDNRFQKQKLGMEQQRIDTEKSRLDLDVTNAATQRRLVDLQVSQADLAARKAKKEEFLQSHNALEPAKQAFGQRAGNAFLEKVKPATSAGVSAENEAQLGPELARQLMPNPQPVPGQVQMPMPQSPQERAMLGIPESLDQPSWSMPQEDFESKKAELLQHLTEQSNAEFDKPFDQMSKEAQESIIEAYQKSAPPGVKISDAEAIQAFRTQQLNKSPVPTPGDYGLGAVGGQVDPLDPKSLKLSLAPLSTGGTEGNEPYMRVGSELKQNPNFVPKKEIVERQEEVRSLAGIHQSIEDVQKNLTEHGIVGLGPTGGGVTGQTVASVGQLLGSPERKIAQRQAEMLISKSVLESVKLMKGNLSDRDVKFLQSTLPKLSDPPAVWTEFLGRWKGLVETSIAQKAGLIPSASLPTVNTPPNLSGVGQRGRGPGGSASDNAAGGSSSGLSSEGMKKFSSEAQLNSAKLPVGTKVLLFDKGTGTYRKAEVTP